MGKVMDLIGGGSVINNASPSSSSTECCGKPCVIEYLTGPV